MSAASGRLRIGDEHWVTPEQTARSISTKADGGRGNNVVSLRGVVAIRK
jgi:hypothetical protein